MNERVIQFRVGVMVLASVLILAILVVLSGDQRVWSWWDDKITIHARFAAAPGVTHDTPVRKYGILIGRVTDVQIEPGGAMVTMEIDQEMGKVHRGEVCQISGNLLSGDAKLDFVGGAEIGDAVLLEDEDVIDGHILESPFDIITEIKGDIKGAFVSLDQAAKEVATLAHRVNTVLGDDDRPLADFMKNTQRALGEFEKTMISLNAIIGDETVQKDLRDGLAKLPQLLEETRQAVKSVRDVATTANRNLKHLEGFTEPLGTNGASIVKSVDESVARLNGLLADLQSFGEALNSREGSLGQFVHNPEVYQRINRAALNMEKLTQELRPVVRDARIFADKIARDPSQLGVRGAIRRGSGAK
jgi:phospholipid/cholesterol/gamma-HCH transport system substrate-binding protein